MFKGGESSVEFFLQMFTIAHALNLITFRTH